MMGVAPESSNYSGGVRNWYRKYSIHFIINNFNMYDYIYCLKNKKE
jgi:hypothetical protein